jgi:HK97 family phage major capsid protein
VFSFTRKEFELNDNQKYGVDSPEYANAYQTYVLRGHKYLSDAELRVLNIGTGGSLLSPTGWAKSLEHQITEDTILSRVQKVESATNFVAQIYQNDITVQTGVAEQSVGTLQSPSFKRPYQGITGTTEYTFSLNKITVGVRVSNELLSDTNAAASVETWLQTEIIGSLIGKVNNQILIGNGSTACQGAWGTAITNSRTASTGVATTNTMKDVLSAAWGSTNSTLEPIAYESWKNCLAVINSRTLGSWDSTAFPLLFPTFAGSMSKGTTVEGLPLVYARLAATTPASGDTIAMFFDPTKYLLVTNPGSFQVTRYGEVYADSNETLILGTVRADGCLLNTSGVLNVTRS